MLSLASVSSPAARRPTTTRVAHATRLAIVFTLALTASLFMPALASATGSIRLAWDASPETDVTGYVISYRAENGSSNGSKNVGLQTTVQLDGLASGQRYFFSVFSYNGSGLRSVPSTEVSGIIDGAADPLPTDQTPQPASQSTYFAEGATGPYDYRLALVNTSAAPSYVNIRFLREGAAEVQRQYTIPAHAHYTVQARDIADLTSQAWSFGAVVAAAPGVVAERTMSWNEGAFAAGAHTAKAIAAPATTWYLAEGAAGFYDTFVLIANPGTTASHVTVDFLRQDGIVVNRAIDVPAGGRRTIFTNEIPELLSFTFGTSVHASQPVLVERSMYFRYSAGGHWEGSASAAVAAPQTHWFLAEGHAGAFFSTFVLLSNPNTSAATVTVRYLTDEGVAKTDTITLGPTSRKTIEVNGIAELKQRPVSFDISSTAPIIAERSMYWPSVPGPWYGVHNSTGTNSLGTEWALAEGELGGAGGAGTYVLLVNPGTEDASVTLSFYRENGLAPISVTRTVGAGKRVTVSAGDEVDGLGAGERFGVHILSSQPIAVERSIYASPNGIFWKTGTNETGTKLK